VALNHFFSSSRIKKERRSAQVMVDLAYSVTLHLRRFHLSSQRR